MHSSSVVSFRDFIEYFAQNSAGRVPVLAGPVGLVAFLTGRFRLGFGAGGGRLGEASWRSCFFSGR